MACLGLADFLLQNEGCIFGFEAFLGPGRPSPEDGDECFQHAVSFCEQSSWRQIVHL